MRGKEERDVTERGVERKRGMGEKMKIVEKEASKRGKRRENTMRKVTKRGEW